MGKRGLSTVITTLILILLVLVAVGIVWVVIKNVISKNTENISLEKFTIDLEIPDIEINNNNLSVKVRRNPGGGELSGIKFLINNGIDTETFEAETNMKELEEQTFILNDSGLVRDVSIAPILDLGSGDVSVGNIIYTYVVRDGGSGTGGCTPVSDPCGTAVCGNVTNGTCGQVSCGICGGIEDCVAGVCEVNNIELVKNMSGLVSWWRFEGDAQDEMGLNYGTINGANCNVNGRYGQACEFDGIDDFINVLDDDSLDVDLNDGFTLMFWIKANAVDGIADEFVTKMGFTGDISYGIELIAGKPRFRICYNGAVGSIVDTPITDVSSIEVDSWNHLTGVYDGTDMLMYINGTQKANTSYSLGVYDSNIGLRIGAYWFYNDYYFNGIIDEVMIFNKSLTAGEITTLYGLDLS